MKMSRAERKAFNLGKQTGYSEGYAKGLYDGNPFNRMLDAVKSLVENMTKPEFIEAIKEAKEAKEVTEDHCEKCSPNYDDHFEEEKDGKENG